MKNSRPYKKTLAELKQGFITQRGIIGMRKALNKLWREELGYSTSSTAPKMTREEADELMEIIRKKKPIVKDEGMVSKGLKSLRSLQWTPKGIKRKNAPLSDAESSCIQLLAFKSFHLVNYDDFGGEHVPVYRAVGTNGSHFTYSKRPWQAGGALTIY